MDNRAVALVHFADENVAVTDAGAGKRSARLDVVFHIRAIHDRRTSSGAVQNPPNHAHGRGLAAGAGDADAEPGAIEELSKKLCAGGDNGADTTRGLHVGYRLLDGSGGDQDLTRAANAAAVLRMKQDAARAEKIESFRISSLIEGAIRTLDPSALRLDDQREGRHAATANAAEKVVSELLHWQKSTSIADEGQLDPRRAMSEARCKIGVVAPSSRMSADVATRVPALAKRLYPDRTPEIVFHPQCFASHGHFAGDDETRALAFLDIANDEDYDAVWFARGGYGSCRVIESIMRGLTETAKRKAYLGYSDTGMLLAALYRAGFAAVAHG